MATVHGEFFQRSLDQFSTSHCRLCGDMVECDEEEHTSSCPLGHVQWWKAVTGCKEAEEVGGTKLEESGEQKTEVKLKVVGEQGLEGAASGSGDVEERQSKSKRKTEAVQVQGKSCNMAFSGIKTLKVKKVVRVANTSKDACPSLKPGVDQKMSEEQSRSLAEGEAVNNCVRKYKIVVSSYEAKVIVGHGGGNVKKLEMMSGARIDVKGQKGASQKTVEISGEKFAVEKAEELVNGFLMKNCTTTLELRDEEAWALVKPSFKSLFSKKRGVDFFIDFQGAYGKSRKLYILGFEEEVKKAQEMINDYLESVLLMPISRTEKDVLLCGGKNNLLCDISKRNLDAYCTIKDHYLLIFGSPEERKKAATAILEQLRLKMT